MKIRILLIVMLGLVGLSTNAQDWQWARNSTLGGPAFNGVYEQKICTDMAGNVYITGNFQTDSIMFGSYILHNSCNSPSPSIFLVKYSNDGNVIWAKSAKGTIGGDNYTTGISTDSLCNVYITGNFQGDSIRFDSILLHQNILQNIFIAKYDSSGNVIWAKTPIGGFVDAFSMDLVSDHAGNTFITGSYQNSIIFGVDTFYSVNPYDDIFIAKYNQSGHVVWAKSIGGNYDEWSHCVCIDSFGNIYIAGEFVSDSIIFGNTTLFNYFYPNNWATQQSDIYIAKFNPLGDIIWAKNIGGNYIDEPKSIDTDLNGNPYITGLYRSNSITFGSTTFTNPNNSQKIFLAKFDTSGVIQWAKTTDGNNSITDVGRCVRIDNNGNAYICGEFDSDSISFDAFTLHNHSQDTTDIFFAKFASFGNPIFVKDFGGTKHENGSGLAIDNVGNLYFTGSFQSSFIPFGADTVYNATGNYMEVFIAKYGFPTGINEPQKTVEGTSVYPNPFSTQATLTIQDIRTNNNMSLHVYNVLGQEVQNVYVGSATSITIHRNNLPSGMYFYKLIDENKEVLGVGKMMVE